VEITKRGNEKQQTKSQMKRKKPLPERRLNLKKNSRQNKMATEQYSGIIIKMLCKKANDCVLVEITIFYCSQKRKPEVGWLGFNGTFNTE